jgi:uncharacterized protein YndB with AHSA1/START domain
MNETAIKITKLLPAPPAEVFAAWTDPQSLRQWMLPGSATGCDVELDVRVGGRFRIVMRSAEGDHVATGEYRKVAPPHALTFTWTSTAIKGTATLVSLEFREHPEGTEMTLSHEGFADAEPAARHRSGWTTIADKLALYLGREHSRIGG